MSKVPPLPIDLPDEKMPDRFDEALEVPLFSQQLPPRAANMQTLPFDGLESFDVFERLVHRILMRQIEFSAPKRYGLSRGEQPGFDLYAARRNRRDKRLTAWECKWWTKTPFNAADLKTGVDRFIERGYCHSVSELIFVVPQPRLKDKLCDAHIEQQARLRDFNVDLDIWSTEEICDLLSGLPEIVDIFFSHHWASAFCSEHAIQYQREKEERASASEPVPQAAPAAPKSQLATLPRRTYAGRHFSWTNGRISLSGFRPRPGEEGISCLLTLSDPGLSGCALSLSGGQVLRTFATGIGSAPEQESRRFIVHAPNQYMDSYTLQIGNARIWLNHADTASLCKAADEWTLTLRAAYRRLIHAWDARGFEVCPEDRRVLIGQISRDAWRVLLAFAHNHDYEKGSSNWHVLDGRSSAIIVYAPETRGGLSPGHHLWITGIPSGNERIDLWWQQPIRDNAISEDGCWGVRTAHRWLCQRLVPAAFQWVRGGKKATTGLLARILRRSSTSDDPLERQTLDELSWARHPLPSELALEAVGGRLEPLVRAVHTALSDGEDWKFSLPPDTLPRIAQAVLVCLEVWDQEHLGYIASKLDVAEAKNIEEMRANIAALHHEHASHGRLEYATRALIDAAAKTDGRLGPERIKRITDLITPLISYGDTIVEIDLLKFS